MSYKWRKFRQFVPISQSAKQYQATTLRTSVDQNGDYLSMEKHLVHQAGDLWRVDDLLNFVDSQCSLEATVLTERALELKREYIKIVQQRAFLREERRRVREEAAAIEQEREEIKYFKANVKPFFSESSQPNGVQSPRAKTRLRFNIGGHTFEASETVLQRDPQSLLAALCTQNSSLQLKEDGILYFDRDWWLFRYILIFLRDGILPGDRRLLIKLYREATFWNLQMLRRAIEETQLCLSRKQVRFDSAGKLQEEELREGWWHSLPRWLEGAWPMEKPIQVPNKAPVAKPPDALPAEPKALAKPKDKPKGDWWTGSEYQSKNYGVLSDAATKVVTEADAADALPVCLTTWERAADVRQLPLHFHEA